MSDRITAEGNYEPSFWLPQPPPWYTLLWRAIRSHF